MTKKVEKKAAKKVASKKAVSKKAAPEKTAKVKKEAAEKPEKVEREESNGVKRPLGAACAAVWAAADELFESTGECPVRAAVMEATGAQGINPATCSTQYQLWRIYNGFSAPR